MDNGYYEGEEIWVIFWTFYISLSEKNNKEQSKDRISMENPHTRTYESLILSVQVCKVLPCCTYLYFSNYVLQKWGSACPRDVYAL